MRPADLLAALSADPPADADLLRRYASARDEAAFELLVRRHAPGVWAACRAVLRTDPHAAEDAFQATFLALATHAGAIHGSVGGWLYRVAHRASLRARRAAGVSRLLIDEHAILEIQQPAHAGRSPDDVAALHIEVAALAEKYRLPVVLCGLAGLSHAEAAERLGWPVGTVAGRLSRAKDQLRRRLARRGVGAAALVAVASAPPTLIRAACSPAAAPPAAVALSTGVLSAMRFAKLKLAAAAVLTAAGLAGTGVMVATSQEKPAPPALTVAAPPAGPLETAFPDILPMDPVKNPCPRFLGTEKLPPAPADDVLKRLEKERLENLVLTAKLYSKLIEGGQWDVNSQNEVLTTHREIPQAALAYFGRTDAVVPWFEEAVAVAKAHEKTLTQRFAVGTVRQQDMTAARAARFHAEIELVKLKAARKP